MRQLGLSGNKAQHADLTVELGFSSDMGATNSRYPEEICEGQLQMSQGSMMGLTYDQLDSAMLQEYTVVVNCSPVGMYPHTHERPDLPYNSLDSRHLLFDLIYNPEETEFLREGRLRGAVTRNGLEMLIGQAHAGWEYWTGTVLP